MNHFAITFEDLKEVATLLGRLPFEQSAQALDKLTKLIPITLNYPSNEGATQDVDNSSQVTDGSSTLTN